MEPKHHPKFRHPKTHPKRKKKRGQNGYQNADKIGAKGINNQYKNRYNKISWKP